MKKYKTQILILISVLLLGGLYVYFQFLLFPKLDVLKSQSSYLKERQMYLMKLEDSSKILPNLEKQIVNLNAEVSALDEKIPKEMDKPEIMLILYNMAKNNELKPQSIEYEAIEDEVIYYKLGLNFSCSGSIENIYLFIEQVLKQKKYIFALDSINISFGEEETSAKIRLVSYTYKKQ